MAEFLEERLPIDVRLGATYADEYAVEITTTRGGSEYRRLIHNYPVRQFTVNYTLTRADLWARIIALYHRAYGMYAGFRVRCADDYSTNAQTGAPTAFDDAMALVSAGVYQIQNYYGAGATPLGIGYPLRTIFKPVAGTVRASIGLVEILNSPVVNWTVDTTTGKITFSANKSAAVTGTGIPKTTTPVVPCAGHTFLVGESVHFTGIVGMIQINGLRGRITAITPGVDITIDIDTTGFTPWSSGGTMNTRPQSGETIKAGCEFDLPCRFNSRIDIQHISQNAREAGSIDIIELVTP
jgi:uncharacterized protein (TIGR02217 family)